MNLEIRSRWAALVLIGVAPWACPQPASGEDTSAASVLAKMRVCAAEKEDSRRLACFDEQMTRAPSVNNAPAGASTSNGQAGHGVANARAVATPSTVPALSPQDGFGMTPELQRKLQSPEQRKQVTKEQLETLSGRVVTLSHRQQGETVITLDNGQIWQQMESDSPLTLTVGQTITIRRGALGSFYLTTPLGFALRVKRIR
jgi:hypothetical protein